MDGLPRACEVGIIGHVVHRVETAFSRLFMTDEESASLGNVLKKAYHALRTHTEAERIYQLCTMEGQPHYHRWILPRGKDVYERGLKFLARDDSYSEEDAIALVGKLRQTMKSG